MDAHRKKWKWNYWMFCVASNWLRFHSSYNKQKLPLFIKYEQKRAIPNIFPLEVLHIIVHYAKIHIDFIPVQMNFHQKTIDFKTLKFPLKSEHLNMENDIHGIVIEIDSKFIKVGFCGEDIPQMIFPSIIASAVKRKNSTASININNNNSQQTKESNESTIFIGNDIQSILESHNILSVQHLVAGGKLVDLTKLKYIWKYIFGGFKDLPKCNVCIIENCFNTNEYREQMIRILFDECNINGLYFNHSSVMAMYGTVRTTALVFSSSDDLTQIIPVYEGHALQNFVKTVEYGRVQLYEMFNNQRIMESMEDWNINYMFDTLKIQELVIQSVMQFDIDIRDEFCRNIVIFGSNTLHDTFEKRLQIEVKRVLCESKNTMCDNIKVICLNERAYLGWIGGSIICSSFDVSDSIYYQRVSYHGKACYVNDGAAGIRKVFM